MWHSNNTIHGCIWIHKVTVLLRHRARCHTPNLVANVVNEKEVFCNTAKLAALWLVSSVGSIQKRDHVHNQIEKFNAF